MGFMLQAAGLAVDAEYHASKGYSGYRVRMLSMRCEGGAIIPCGTCLGWAVVGSQESSGGLYEYE